MPMTQSQLDNWFTYHAPTTNEQEAEALYDTWRDQPGWVPWVAGGNSDMQDLARTRSFGRATGPKYEAIRKAEHACWVSIQQGIYENLGLPQLYTLINEECKMFAVTIDNLAPDSADKAAAIRCVRLARNAFNECVTVPTNQDGKRDHLPWLFTVAQVELVKARWQANSAIACGGV